MRIKHCAGRPAGGTACALFGIVAGLLLSTTALAAFSTDMQSGLDNAQFQFYSYVDGNAGEFYLVTGTGADGDAVRSGAIGSTSSYSAESGVYFNVVGPGTIKFRWKISGQTLVSGKGAILQYNMWDPNNLSVPYVNAFITGVQDWAEVTIPVPAASRQIIISYVRSYGSSAVGSDAGWVDQLTWTPASGSDTTPDAFGFTPLSDAPLATAMTSNVITVGGINAAAAISIDSCTGTNCAYSVNGGAYTSTAGTVSNGDTVRVRQTSSASYSTTTALTLTIGGVTGTFNVTTLSPPTPIAEGPTPTGTGIAKAFADITGNVSPECHVSQTAFANAPVPPPAGVTLPHGMFGFTVSGCTSNFSVNATIEYPSAIPAGASYWKYDAANGWYTIPATINGNKVSFTIADNGLGDSDAALGTIADPGGIGLGQPMGGEAPIPTLSQWGLLALAGLLGFTAWFAMRERSA